MAETSLSVSVPASASATRILHVDDDEANRYAVTRSLVRAGFEVIEAATGAEALAALAKYDGSVEAAIDLILLDVRLPDIDGFELCRRVKADPRTAGVPVLHLSANFISSEDKAHGLDGGADAYLIRPVAPVELIATVKALLRVRRAEEELRMARDEALAARAAAETANRIKDEFLATLSHELRTPLTAIVGWASILQRGRVTPEEHLEGLRTIERNAKAQAKLIEDLLDVSRIISGKLRLDAQPVDVMAAIDAALTVVRPVIETKKIELVRNLHIGPPLLTFADPTRLQQIFGNILGNAVKFTPDAGQIRVAARRVVGGYLEITIADTGRGIRPDFLPFIFERFRQADISSRRAEGGLGLGLAIVRQLVELHGGSIRATSDGESQGATFIIRLPDLDTANSRTAEALNIEPPIPASTTLDDVQPLSGFTVLLVEDDADCRLLAARILTGSGARVVETSSVQAAMQALGRDNFDLIVSDIAMPGEDGYDFIRRVRSLTADAGGRTPALALSAFVGVENQQKMLASGFDAHLGKPVDPHALCTAIARLIEAARADQAGTRVSR